jgi:GDP-6-deoxy-D-talose 4-dehydrogenase
LKILITGASGFTGRHFISIARSAGHEISILESNINDVRSIASELTGRGQIDAVVHLAGAAFVGQANSAGFYEVNTVGTGNLLESLASGSSEARSPVVLLASSANIYGNCEQSPITEDQPPKPVNHYAASKLAMEHIAHTYCDRMKIVMARPFNYTGPGQASSFLIPKLVDHFVRRAPEIELGNLHVEREFNDVRMVCDAYLSLLNHGVPGEVYNVCSGHPHTLLEVIAALEALTGHQIQVKVNPAFVRASEVRRLCGDPGKLIACIGSLQSYTLTDTLSTMLEAARPA